MFRLMIISMVLPMIILGCAPGSLGSEPTAAQTKPSESPSYTLDPPNQNDPSTTDGFEENGNLHWDQAVNLIMAGKVKQVVQFHDLTVILVLDDDTIVESVQPEIDDVFSVIDLCGERCAEVMIVTE